MPVHKRFKLRETIGGSIEIIPETLRMKDNIIMIMRALACGESWVPILEKSMVAARRAS